MRGGVLVQVGLLVQVRLLGDEGGADDVLTQADLDLKGRRWVGEGGGGRIEATLGPNHPKASQACQPPRGKASTSTTTGR